MSITTDKAQRGINFFSVAGGGINIADLVPYTTDKSGNQVVVKNPFEIYWWNTDPLEGHIGNHRAVRRDFYWVGEDPSNPEYPIRPGDEDFFEEGWIWLDQDDPSTWVWVDNTDSDYPIRYATKVFKAGDCFFTQPTAEGTITVSGSVLQPSENAAYFPVAFNKEKTSFANPFPVNLKLEDLVPMAIPTGKTEPELTKNPFEIWWWNADPSKEAVGNHRAVRRDFYWVGEDPANPDYPIRPGDEDFFEEGWIWLDQNDPSTWVWVDNTDSDYPIRYSEKVIGIGEGFFSQPTVDNPVLMFPNPFYKPEN